MKKDFALVDLSLGLNVNESMTEFQLFHKLLSFSKLMVEQAKPFFLLFIGEEYGPKIDQKIINTFYPELDVTQPLSIAEVQFLLRTLTEENLDKIYVYIKNKDTIENKDSLAFIKKVTKLIPAENIREYISQDRKLPKLIIGDLKNAISNFYQPVLEETTELIYNVKKCGRDAIGFKRETERLMQRITKKHNTLFAVYGARGSGKSTFLAKAYNEIAALRYEVHYLSFKDLEYSIDESAFLMQISVIIADIIGFNHDEMITTSDTLIYIQNLLTEVPENTRIVIIVDDIDYISLSQEPFSWFSQKFNPIQFIVSVSNEAFLRQLIRQGAELIEIEAFEKENINLLIAQITNRHFVKLSQDILDAVHLKVTKHRELQNPLAITTLINSLIYLNPNEYYNIYKTFEVNEPSLRKAIETYQKELIKAAPLSLSEVAAFRLKTFLQENKANAVLLAFLAFSGPSGVELDEINKLLNHFRVKFHYETFLGLKFALGNFVKVHNFNNAWLLDDFVIKAVFEVLKPDFINIVATILATGDDYFSYYALVTSVIYVENFDYLLELYEYENEDDRAFIRRYLLNHPAQNDYVTKFIYTKALNLETFIFLKELYLTNIKYNAGIKNESFLFLSNVLSRIVSDINEFKDKSLLTYFFAIFGEYICAVVPKDKLEKTGGVLFDFAIQNKDYYTLDNVYVFRFFDALAQIGRYLENGLVLVNDLLTVYSDKINNLTPDGSEVDLAINKFLYNAFQLFNEDNNRFLDNYIKIYKNKFNDELRKATLIDQIHHIHFIANSCRDQGRINNSLDYYYLLYRALKDEKLFFPLTEELIIILSNTTNSLASFFIAHHLHFLSENPFFYKIDDHKYTEELDFIETLVIQSVYAAINIFNAKESWSNLYNLNISNLNYAIFYASFRNDFKLSVQYLTTSIRNTEQQMKNDLYDHHGICNFLLYIQIFIDYYREDGPDVIEILQNYIKNLKKHPLKQSNINLKQILDTAKRQREYFLLENSAKYNELERELYKLVKYLSEKLP